MEITLDISNKDPAYIKPIRLKQGEKGFPISVTVTDLGHAYDLFDKTVRFMATRPDGHVIIEPATQEGENRVSYDTSRALTEIAGDIRTAYFEVVDSDGSRIGATRDVPFVIERGSDASSEHAGDYIPEFDRMLADGNAAISAVSESLEKVGESLGKVEQAAESAEGALAKANEAAQKAEAAANTAKQAVEVVDGIKGDAASAIGAANSAASDAASAASSANSAASRASSAAASASSAASAAENAAKAANDAAGNLDATVGEALAGKADAEHAHSAADITSGTLEAARLPSATCETAGAVKLYDIDNPDVMAVPTYGIIAYQTQGLVDSINVAIGAKADAGHTHATSDIVSGSLSISRGGTGATTAAAARTNLGITPANIGAMPAVAVTASDAGKFLRVQSDGTWAAEAVPSASGVSF